jgi:hemolysin activation/secretion protein
VRRLGSKGAQVILRSAFQWSDDPLLSLEQFPLGGVDTVRGYRENQLVRDEGVQGSIELRVPVWSAGNGSPVVQVAAFYDIGAAWNVDEPTPTPRMIHSAGAGLLLTPSDRVTAQIYWGYAFTDISADKKNLQDYGLHFRLSLRAF